MRPAMDSALKSAKRWVVWSIGLALGCGSPGCARLREFRAGDRPVLGALSQPKTDDRAAKGDDLYAQSVNKGRSESLQARRETAPREDEPTSPGEDRELALPSTNQSPEPPERNGRGSMGVALQPPVALPSTKDSATKDSEPAVASNLPSPSWQRKEPDEPSQPIATQPRPRGKPSSPPAAATLESILTQSRAKLETLKTYQVLLTGQERVGGQLQPAEEILLSIRRNPKAVRLEWTGGPHKGREVIYSSTENDGLMHVNMADSVVPVPRLSIPPDSPLALRNGRHPITEAGFDTILRNVEKAIERAKAGDSQSGQVTYAGVEQPGPLEHPCHKIVRVTLTGETWLVYIDPQTKLPALVQANAADGELIELYRFRNPKPNVPELAQADAFDVNRRWGEPKGLLSRLARAGAGTSKPTANPVTR